MHATRARRPARSRGALAVLTLAVLAVACDQSDAIREEALRDSTAITFETSDGVQLAGRLFGPEDATSGVVLAHMLPADQTSWFDFAHRLGEEGYRVLTFNFRGYCPGGPGGCSAGDRSVVQDPVDLTAAIERLREEGLHSVSLVGASMGGTASLVVGSQESDEIAAVIALSAPTEIEGLSAGPEVLQTVTAAKLFIAGNGDGNAASDAKTFYDESLQPKRYEILTTSDHGTDLLEGNQGEQTRELILGWLAQYAPAENGK